MFSKILFAVLILAASANCIAQSPAVTARPVSAPVTTVTNRSTTAPSIKNISKSPKEVKKRKVTANVVNFKKVIGQATPSAK